MALLACNFISQSSAADLRNWNMLIKDQLVKGNAGQAFSLYRDMQELGFHGDNYTFPILLKAVGQLSSSRIGHAIHAQVIKTGFSDHVFVQTSLLNLYMALQSIDDAYKVFDKMPVKDLVAWNSMLDAFASCGQMGDAMKLFDSMPVKDLVSFNTMISGYARNGTVANARALFDQIPVKDTVSWNSMLLAYTSTGDIGNANGLFKQIPAKNVITWNTMITGYLRSQLYSEAVDLFDQMEGGNVKPDSLTVAAALSSCAHLGSLERGKQIHIYAISNGLASNPNVATALIDMYAKCGSIENSIQVFYKSQVKDTFCWNSMISGLALHGYGYEALKLFNKMRDCKNPDAITFIGLLSACTHAGLVQEGRELFDSMEKEFGIAPKLEHYGCMVDLLGRAGLIERAMELVETMGFEPGESVLGALLSACVVHQDVERGKRVMKLVSEKGKCLSDGELMMFANLYACCGEWEEANKWRDMMNDAGIVKTAGFSAIEIDGRFHKFLAGEIGVV